MEKVGFIGLGIMGKPMAMNLIRKGYSVLILEGSKAAQEMSAAGARICKTGKELANNSDAVITMLPDSGEVEDVVLPPGGILEGIRRGSLFIDMSTIAPRTATKLSLLFEAKGVESLDAPVSGGQVGAETASLSVMVGGKSAAFARALPILQAMGKNIVHIGEAGAGQTTKACNQMIVAMTIQAVAEAFVLARRAGLDLEKMREALLGGFAQSRILDLHGKRIIEENYKPGFKVRLHRKDLNIALQTAKEFSVPLYGTSQVAAHMDALLAQGKGELDHSAIAFLLEQLSASNERK